MRYLVLAMLLVGCGGEFNKEDVLERIGNLEHNLRILDREHNDLYQKTYRLHWNVEKLPYLHKTCQTIANRFYPQEESPVKVDLNRFHNIKTRCIIGKHTGTPTELLERVIKEDVEETLKRLRDE